MESLDRQEVIGDHSWTPDEEIAGQYRDSALNYKLRWEVYKLAVPPVDIHQEAARRAHLEGHERILDIGCGDGTFEMDYLRGGLHHQGEIIAVDKFENLVDTSKFILKRRQEQGEDLPNIEFRKMDVANLRSEDDSIEDNSFDVVFALFVLYHTDPEKALGEIKRVLKPGGKLIVATSGESNKQKHRQFESEIAGWVTAQIQAKGANLSPKLKRDVTRLRKSHEVLPPRIMNRRFNSQEAESILPAMFTYYAEPFPQESPIVVRNEEEAEMYYWSLKSMQSVFRPAPSIGLFNAALETVVKLQVEDEIKANGYFEDRVERDIFFCLNDK